MEVDNEEDVNTWVGQASVNNYILEDMCRSALEKVTCVESPLAIHELIVQVLDPINHKTITEDANSRG